MRRTAGLAALAVAAATAAALPLATAPTRPAAPGRHRRGPDGRRRRCAAPRPHPGAARAADGQAFVARATVVDADGSTPRALRPHPRRPAGRRRRPRRAPATPTGAWARREPDPGRAADARHRGRRSPGRGAAHRPGPQRPHLRRARRREGRGQRAGRRRHRCPARLAWEVVTGGTQADGTPLAPRDLRRRPHRQGHPQRAADRQRRRPGPDALQRHGPAAGERLRVDVHAQGRRRRGDTYTTDMDNKPRTRSSARSSARAARPARTFTVDDDHVRQRLDQQPRDAPAPTRSTAPT